MRTRKTGIQKLINELKTGRDRTVAQLERKTGLANVSAAVNTLRRDYGYRIKTDPETRAYRMQVTR